MFRPDTYVGRRARLASQFKDGILLFLGNEESPMNYADNTYHFRQDSSFLYYMGIDQPGWAAILDVESGETTAFQNDLDLDSIVWTGVLPTVAELAARGGITRTAPTASLAEELNKAKAKGRTIRFLPPYRGDNVVKLFRLLGVHPDDVQAQASVDFVRAVVEMRVRKDAEELAEIEKAVNISTDMHVEAAKMARPGMLEAEIAARVTEIAMNGGGNISFPVIATVHGETLHNHYHGNRLDPGRLFILDAGAESTTHYAGDLTSTFPVDRSFTKRQREIYDIVIAGYDAGVAASKVGVNFKEAHLAAARAMADGLKGLGLMKGDLGAAIEQGAHALFFPHGLGHMMGLDVHDMEDLGENWVGHEGRPRSTQFGLKSLRFARPIEPGFVFTMEPGIYFIPQLIDRWKADGKFTDYINYDALGPYRDFGGIRYEDNYVATPSGCHRIGKPRPKQASEIEALRQS